MANMQFISCRNCAVKSKGLFENLTEEELDNFDYHKSCARHKKGQILFHEGTRPLGIYCINRGKIKIYQTGSDGKDQIIKIASSGDILGYKALISDHSYPVTGETLEDTSVCFIPKDEFLKTLHQNPTFGQKLLQLACQEIGSMTGTLTGLAQKSVRERLAVTLLMLKDTYGLDPIAETEDNNTDIEINLTREDLANIVGTATETVIRLLHDLKEDKLISTKGRKIKVLEPEKLSRIANF